MKTIIAVFVTFVLSITSVSTLLEYALTGAEVAKDSIQTNVPVLSYLASNKPRYASLNVLSFNDPGVEIEAVDGQINISPKPVSANVLTIDQVEGFEMIYGRQDLNALSGGQADMVYINSFTELPLVRKDYYWGKYENGLAGVNGLNRMPVFKPGDGLGVIASQYINVKSYNGYIQPKNGYYFGSGLCWSTSELGYLMDQANADFQAKYGIALFTFKRGDRAPHSSFYKSYLPSNRGYGYTVMQKSAGVPVQDYRFPITPALKNREDLKDIKVKIVMLASTTHPTAHAGQSIGGYVLSNVDF
jgi:hypothetical protein